MLSPQPSLRLLHTLRTLTLELLHHLLQLRGMLRRGRRVIRCRRFRLLRVCDPQRLCSHIVIASQRILRSLCPFPCCLKLQGMLLLELRHCLPQFLRMPLSRRPRRLRRLRRFVGRMPRFIQMGLAQRRHLFRVLRTKPFHLRSVGGAGLDAPTLPGIASRRLHLQRVLTTATSLLRLLQRGRMLSPQLRLRLLHSLRTLALELLSYLLQRGRVLSPQLRLRLLHSLRTLALQLLSYLLQRGRVLSPELRLRLLHSLRTLALELLPRLRQLRRVLSPQLRLHLYVRDPQCL